MEEFSAFTAFPADGRPAPSWAFLRTNGNGQSILLDRSWRSPFGHCLAPSDPAQDYPFVCKVLAPSVEHGEILEPGYLLLQPHNVRQSPTPEATIRFTAPESGTYVASIEIRTASLAYGGTSFHLYKQAGAGSSEILSQQIPKRYGHQRAFTPSVALTKGETLSLSIGPSPNGDAASDGTLVRFDIVRHHPPFAVSGGSLAVLGLLAVLCGAFLWRRFKSLAENRSVIR